MDKTGTLTEGRPRLTDVAGVNGFQPEEVLRFAAAAEAHSPQADIGIAIGAGTDVAIETAELVLMRSDPADVLRAIFLSKATVGKMRQNLFWASCYNILAIPVAAGILYPRLASCCAPSGRRSSCPPPRSSWPPTRCCSRPRSGA
jgi:cation transport ATPase